ncbi:MAG: endonuclease/exonuclease/phosphatase family protein, partial [Burkholderiales bacterium]
LRAVLSGYSLHFAAATDVDDGRGGRSLFGNLIATRLPVRQILRHQLPWPPDASVPSMARVALEAVIQTKSGLIRVTCTHLEYYSPGIRTAQVRALRELHRQACARSRAPRPGRYAGDPFEAIDAPCAAIIAGDFNFRPETPEYAELTAPFNDETPALADAWTLANPGRSRPPTFRLHDPNADEAPYCCDFCFVSEDLAPRLLSVAVDETTQASDHQPIIVELSD